MEGPTIIRIDVGSGVKGDVIVLIQTLAVFFNFAILVGPSVGCFKFSPLESGHLRGRK